MTKFSFNLQKKESAEFYDEFGYVVYKDIADKKIIQTMKETINQILKLQTKKSNLGDNFKFSNGFDNGMMELSEKNDLLRKRFYEISPTIWEVHSLATQPIYREVAVNLGISLPMLGNCQIRMDLPGDERFLLPPHQELRGMKSPNMISFITALCDINPENGALSLAPGSHKLGILKQELLVEKNYHYVPEKFYKGKYDFVQASLKEGESVLIHPCIIHASCANVSKKIRWSHVARFEDSLNMPFLLGGEVFL